MTSFGLRPPYPRYPRIREPSEPQRRSGRSGEKKNHVPLPPVHVHRRQMGHTHTQTQTQTDGKPPTTTLVHKHLACTSAAQSLHTCIATSIDAPPDRHTSWGSSACRRPRNKHKEAVTRNPTNKLILKLTFAHKTLCNRFFVIINAFKWLDAI